MPRNPLHDVAIVGAYNTRQARRIDDASEVAILMDAIRGALANAGLPSGEVDGVNVTSSTWGLNTREAVHMLGGAPSWTGLESGIGAVLEAASAIATGLCHTVLIASAQVGEYVDRASTAPWTRPSNEFVECWGLFTAAEFALVAQRHMDVYGTKPEQLAEVAAAIRSNGAMNPEAVMYGREVTPEDVMASRPVATPFRLLDCCITSEGGAGLVMTTSERARDLPATPVFILGGGQDRRGMPYVTAPIWDQVGSVGRHAAELCWEMSGLRPEDVDVAELYDNFSFEVIRQLEAFGFCEEGEGGAFVEGGRIRIDGALPVATNGGLLSYSHAGLVQALQKPIAAVQQLRGDLPEGLDVRDARVALTSNGGAGAFFDDVLLLGLEGL